jgi:hypothetical protein
VPSWKHASDTRDTDKKLGGLACEDRGDLTVYLVLRATGMDEDAVMQLSHSTRMINHCIRRKISANCRTKSTKSSEVPTLGDTAKAQEQRKMKLLAIAQ